MAVKRLTNLRIQYDDGTGVLASNYRLFFYAAGSSTKQNTYNSSAGTVANSNPIVLNALGEPAVEIWLTAGQSYKIGLAIAGTDDPPASFVWTEDNVAGVNDTTLTIDEWLSSGQTPTYVSATSFTMPGDQTSEFHVGRRLKTTNSGGTIYSTIITSAFAASTTITVANDSGVLDVGLSAVSYGIARANNPSVSPHMINRKGAAVASAGTTNIWGIVGDYVHITGTTGITSFGTAPYAGAERTVVFDGALTLTQNATTLALPGGQNITTAAGDTAIVRADTTANMIVVDFQRASGVPVVGTQTANTVFAGPSSGAAAVPAFRVLTAADGAAYAWIVSAAVSNAATLDLFWTALQASAVDVIDLEFVGLVNATNNQGTLMRVSTDGSTFDTGNNYQWTNQYQQSNPAANTNAGSGGVAASIQFIQQTNNGAASTGSGTAALFQPSNASITKLITGKVISVTSGNGVQDGSFGGMYTPTTALRGIRLFAGAGNITGTIYAKGRLKA